LLAVVSLSRSSRPDGLPWFGLIKGNEFVGSFNCEVEAAIFTQLGVVGV
jgi:hypothetical protein